MAAVAGEPQLASRFGINSLLHDAAAASRMIGMISAEFESGRLPPPKPPTEITFDKALASYDAVNQGTAEKIVFKMMD